MIFELSFPPLMIGIIFHFGEWDPPAVRRFAKKKKYSDRTFAGVSHDIEDCDGLNWRSGNTGNSLVWLPQIPKSRYEEGVLSHEITHAVQHALSYIGSDCQEVSAHLAGWMYTQSMERVDKLPPPAPVKSTRKRKTLENAIPKTTNIKGSPPEGAAKLRRSS